MKFVALEQLPQGQQPGELFEATEDAGMVLVNLGAARKAEPDESEPSKPARRRYQRRDLEADPT
jgi:hypothetical protein